MLVVCEEDSVGAFALRRVDNGSHDSNEVVFEDWRYLHFFGEDVHER